MHQDLVWPAERSRSRPSSCPCPTPSTRRGPAPGRDQRWQPAHPERWSQPLPVAPTAPEPFKPVVLTPAKLITVIEPGAECAEGSRRLIDTPHAERRRREGPPDFSRAGLDVSASDKYPRQPSTGNPTHGHVRGAAPLGAFRAGRHKRQKQLVSRDCRYWGNGNAVARRGLIRYRYRSVDRDRGRCYLRGEGMAVTRSPPLR